MMTLKEAAKYADKTVFTDTYGTATFYGQLHPFTDNVRSSQAARRRILETAPEVSMPARQTVTEGSSGVVYLVAYPAVDSYKGRSIRFKYPACHTDGVFSVRTIAQVLANSGGVTDAYVAVSYVKQWDQPDSSFFFSNFELTYARSLTVAVGDILIGAGKYFLAMQPGRVDDIGFGAVDVTEIVSPLATVTFKGYSGVIVPSTDAYTETTITNVPIFIEHTMLDYVHEALGFVKLEPGDKAISFLKSKVTTVRPGDIIGTYRVIAVSDSGSTWKVHARRSS